MNNIFLVHTEYHLLTTFRVIFDKYKDDNNFIYIASEHRIQGEIKSSLPNVHTRRLPHINYGVYSTLKEFEILNPKNFFFFQDNSSDNIYLSYHLNKLNVNVALVQDGLKPYPIWHRRFLLLNCLKETFEFYKQMFRRWAVIPTLFIKSYKYGKLRFINQLWVDYPNKLPYIPNKKEIIPIPLLNDDVVIEVSRIFKFKPSVPLNNIILYIGHPIRSKLLRKREIKIIKEIISNNQDKPFLFKKHPNISQEQLSLYDEIAGFSYLEDIVPAELIIASMKDSIIVSRYSTALITNNPNCRFYWTHRLYNNVEVLSQLEIINPTSHITEVNDIAEIK